MQKQNITKGGLNQGLGKLKRIFSGEENILDVIREDHKPLKELIEVMKDAERPFAERKQAFTEFAPLLITHAEAEEKALYEFMKTKKDLKMDAFEGDTEHMLADQLCEQIERVTDEDEMGAMIKVLAESVEHHIKEEENDMFPEIEKSVKPEQLVSLTKKYIEVQTEIIAAGQDNSPSEKDLQ